MINTQFNNIPNQDKLILNDNNAFKSPVRSNENVHSTNETLQDQKVIKPQIQSSSDAATIAVFGRHVFRGPSMEQRLLEAINARDLNLFANLLKSGANFDTEFQIHNPEFEKICSSFNSDVLTNGSVIKCYSLPQGRTIQLIGLLSIYNWIEGLQMLWAMPEFDYQSAYQSWFDGGFRGHIECQTFQQNPIVLAYLGAKWNKKADSSETIKFLYSRLNWHDLLVARRFFELNELWSEMELMISWGTPPVPFFLPDSNPTFREFLAKLHLQGYRVDEKYLKRYSPEKPDSQLEQSLLSRWLCRSDIQPFLSPNFSWLEHYLITEFNDQLMKTRGIWEESTYEKLTAMYEICKKGANGFDNHYESVSQAISRCFRFQRAHLFTHLQELLPLSKAPDYENIRAQDIFILDILLDLLGMDISLIENFSLSETLAFMDFIFRGVSVSARSRLNPNTFIVTKAASVLFYDDLKRDFWISFLEGKFNALENLIAGKKTTILNCLIELNSLVIICDHFRTQTSVLELNNREAFEECMASWIKRVKEYAMRLIHLADQKDNAWSKRTILNLNFNRNFYGRPATWKETKQLLSQVRRWWMEEKNFIRRD